MESAFTFEVEQSFKDGKDEWHSIPHAQAYSNLSGYYIDMSLIVDALDRGEVINTSFAYYRRAK